MKNMKKLLQKAMVFTLTAAMLVGTPLTASAAGLVDLYQIEDGWGNVTGNDDNTRTGTVTATQTNSGILEANAQLEGIVLDETNLELEIPEEGTLTASLDWGETTKDAALEEKLLKTLQWKSSSTDIVAIRVPNRSYNGGPRDVIQVVPKAAGTATITVSLDSKEYDLHYTAEATVTVVQYADELKFNDAKIKEDAYSGNALALNDYVDRYVGGKVANTSDVLTFAVKADSKVATLKNNVLTLKKDGKIQVLAIGKKVTSGWKEITIEKGVNVKKLVVDGDKNQKWNINEKGVDGYTVKVKAEQKDGEGKCTNQVSWTSKKPAIVDIASSDSKFAQDDTCSATLVAKAPGKAQIVAKASNGKSATITVTVSADLTKIEIVNAPAKLYSGQTIDLYGFAEQYFETKGPKGFTDAGLKWSFADTGNDLKAVKKVASINAKGVLTIKPDVSVANGKKTLTVKAVGKKKVNNKIIESNVVTINLEQVNVTEITVSKGNTAIATATVNPANGKVTVNKPVNTDTIAVDGSRIYKLTAKGTIENGAVQDLDGSVLGWTASGNGKTVNASKNAYNNGVIKAIKKGTATVTINSATKKGNKFVAVKTTFKAKVTAPTKTLTLSVKNKGIAATGKKQTISITPVLQKGSTTNKNKDIVWTATKNGETFTGIDPKTGKMKNVVFGEADLGAKIKVTAKVKNGGPSTSITLTVVKESKNVEFQQNGAKITKLNNISADQAVAVKVNLKAGGNSDPGKDNVSGVTYTVNKAGIVRIVENADGTIKIEPLNNGSVKITATTLDGKKGTLNVKVAGLQ